MTGRPRLTRQRSYNWDSALAGDLQRLYWDRDFMVSPESFRVQVLQAAKRRDVAVWTRRIRDPKRPKSHGRSVVEFQAYPDRAYAQGPPKS